MENVVDTKDEIVVEVSFNAICDDVYGDIIVNKLKGAGIPAFSGGFRKINVVSGNLSVAVEDDRQCYKYIWRSDSLNGVEK